MESVGSLGSYSMRFLDYGPLGYAYRRVRLEWSENGASFTHESM